MIHISGSIILNAISEIAVKSTDVLSEHHIALIHTLNSEYANANKLSRTKHRQIAAILQKNVTEFENKIKESNIELYMRIRFGVKQAIAIEKRCIDIAKEFDKNRRRGNVIFVDDIETLK